MADHPRMAVTATQGHRLSVVSQLADVSISALDNSQSDGKTSFARAYHLKQRAGLDNYSRLV